MVHINSLGAGSTPRALARAARFAMGGLAPALLCAAAWAQANPVPGQVLLVDQGVQSLNLRSTVRLLQPQPTAQPVVRVKAVAPPEPLRQLTAEERTLLRRQLTRELRAQRSGPESVQSVRQ